MHLSHVVLHIYAFFAIHHTLISLPNDNAVFLNFEPCLAVMKDADFTYICDIGPFFSFAFIMQK